MLSETQSAHSCLSSPLLQSLLSSLEGFISQLFHEIGILSNDSLDGIYAEIVDKRARTEMYLLGNCIFINDQCLTPIEVSFSVATERDEIDWCECRLGEMGPKGMIRTPYGGKIRLAVGRANDIEWCYHFGYDHRAGKNGQITKP